MSVPVWLLDVDGVLNVVGLRPPVGSWPTWSRGRATTAGRQFLITWSPDLVAAIRGLHDAGAVELRWLTTWAHDANGELGRLLGMPELAVAGAPPQDLLGPRWWKLAHAQAAAAEGRPVVWTDDDLAVEAEGADWARSQPQLRPHPGARRRHVRRPAPLRRAPARARGVAGQVSPAPRRPRRP